MEDLKTKIHEAISKVVEEDNILGNVDLLYKLVDIHKDISNEEYWKNKEEIMKVRYGENYRGEYGNYGEEYGAYGRRGVPGTGRGRRRYRGSYSEGEEMLEEMKESYGAYSEGREQYGRGNYGAEEESMKALEDTMELFTEFAYKMLKEVDSPEAKQVIKKSLRKISQMSEM